MNKKVFHCNGKTILTIAVTSLLVGCNSELDLASYQQKEEKSIVSSNIDTQTQATTTDYLGKSFYLSSQDGEQSLLTTRTGIGAEKLTRSFVVNAESEQEKCLGVHVMAACVNEGKSLQKIEVWVNKEKTMAKEVSYTMFCTLFSEYADVIEKVKQDWRNKQYDENGAYIAPLPETFLKEYVKKLIDKII